MFSFSILAEEGEARAGRLHTPHGSIETPAFVPVGTAATVKALSPGDLEETGTRVIIANTYHLHLRLGEDLIAEAGGLHRFMGWEGPLMTDSGGFQIFSLGAGKEHGVGKIAPIFPGHVGCGGQVSAKKGAPLVRLGEEGAQFVSYLDGSPHRFTPEGVIRMQERIGADIIVVLDECTSPLHDYDYTRMAMNRTHRWAIRGLEEFRRNAPSRQALFGIIQGGAYRDLREQSASFIARQGFSGYAIGGSLGRSKAEMHQVLDWTIPFLPREKPRHLLGIGEVEDIFEVVERGIDLFDCVLPTLMAGTGTFFAKKAARFRIHILNKRFRDDPRPVEEGCRCYTCRNYSRAYLRHLFEARELLAIRLASIHNVHFLASLLRSIRNALQGGRLAALKKKWLSPTSSPDKE